MRYAQSYEDSLLSTWCELAMLDQVLALIDSGFASEGAEPAHIGLHLVMHCIGDALVDGIVRQVVVYVNVIMRGTTPELRRELGL